MATKDYVEKKYEEMLRVAQTVVIDESDKYNPVARVPSTTSGTVYVPAIDPSTWQVVGKCQCKAVEFGLDCKHVTATNHVLRDRATQQFAYDIGKGVEEKNRVSSNVAMGAIEDLVFTFYARNGYIAHMYVSGEFSMGGGDSGMVDAEEVDVENWLAGLICKPTEGILMMSGYVYIPVDGYVALVRMEAK